MTPPVPPLTGVVLAGGRSSRMGSDKALLRVGGRRLIDLAVDALTPLCGEVLVAAGPRVVADLTVRQIHDAGDRGPLAGIVAALGEVSTDLAVVVAVDMPAVDVTLLADLARRWNGEPAVMPSAGGRLQPLHAVYATAALARLQDCLQAGIRSPARALVDLGALIVDVDDDAFARNLNLPSDLPGGARSG